MPEAKNTIDELSMKRTKILPAIEKAIKERSPLPSAWYWLCWSDNQIKCIGGGNVPPPEMWFGKITTQQIMCGMKAFEWHVLEARVAHFLKQKGLL